MQGKFIYVFNQDDRDTLLKQGLKLVYSRYDGRLFVFANQGTMTFSVDNMEHVFSDTLIF